MIGPSLFGNLTLVLRFAGVKLHENVASLSQIKETPRLYLVQRA